MSDTLGRLQTMLADQLGMQAAEIGPDSPLRAIGMDAADFEQLSILIEQNFNIDLSVIEEEHHEVDIDRPPRDIGKQTPRQLANWIDDWLSRDAFHTRAQGKLTKPS